MPNKMDDKTILFDCLKDLKFIAGNYTTMSTEIANTNLLNDTMKICQDELRSNYDIFNILHQNGWYPVTPAGQQDITKLKTKSQQLQSSF